MTDEQWRKLDWEDAYYSALEKEYKPPRFDPLIAFDPPMSIIKEVIKKLKQQCYEYRDKIRALREAGLIGESTTKGPEAWLSQTVSKIKGYEFRLRARERTGSWEHVEHSRTISEYHIRRAKETPITSLYTGATRRSGSNLVGRCPFHDERTGSFYIYVGQNTWHCFGCSAGGDSIDYIIKMDGLDFIGAVKYLNNVN